jgi:flagellar hook-basal body complex protein FliE
MRVNPVGQVADLAAGKESKNPATESFAKILQEKLAEVDALQKKASALLEGFLAGEVTDVHQVILAAQQAELALALTVEIRNRVIEAYQEIARMQI